ncbi:MAG: hypothetical protein HKN47_15480 [Pirellulaceae bacterium]|nr:hypothetical protein [Pirellulaceae bacterium]
MSLLWILALVYLGTTYAFSLWALTCCVPDDESYAQIAASKGYSPLRIKLVTFALVPFLGPLMPLVGIACVVKSLRRRRELIKMSRQYLAPQHRRVPRDECPVAFQQTIKQFQSPLETAGFTVDGYFHLKDKPFVTHACQLVSDDGTVMASLSTCDESAGIELQTILSDQGIVNTAAVICPLPADKLEKLNQPGRMSIQTIGILEPEFSIDRLLELHRRHVAEESTADNAPLQFTTNQSVELSVYMYRLFHTILFDTGELDERPPRPICPKPIGCESQTSVH